MADELPHAELCSLIEGPVARLTLTRSDVFNAMNIQMISEIISFLDWTEKRSVARTRVT